MMTTKQATIFIRLLEEGIDVWRPAQALRQETQNHFRVLEPSDYDPSDEKWEFPPDSVVVCEQRSVDGEDVLVAIELVEDSSI